MNTYQSMNPEAFSEEYEEEQRVLRELAEAKRVEIAGLVIDLALAKLEAEMAERGEDYKPEFEPEDYEPEDNYTDAEADADTLASAGMGTDEDYGYFGDDPYEGDY